MHLLSSTIALGILANLLPGARSDCLCTHNDVAGSWDDHNSPAVALAILVVKNGVHYDGSVEGHMSINFSNINGNFSGNTTDCNSSLNIKSCLLTTAETWQNWNDVWWLWSVIHCEDSDGIADFRIWA